MIAVSFRICDIPWYSAQGVVLSYVCIGQRLVVVKAMMKMVVAVVIMLFVVLTLNYEQHVAVRIADETTNLS